MRDRPEVLAIIPARGGGQLRLGEKTVAGTEKLRIVRAIEQALACTAITRTVVATDDDELAEAAWDAGAQVPFKRTVEDSNDRTTAARSLWEVLAWLAENESYHPQLVVCLKPTQIVRDPARIEDAIALMLHHPEADALEAVEPVEQKVCEMWLLEGRYLTPLLGHEGAPMEASARRHALPVYVQNGYVEVLRPRAIAAFGFTGTRVIPYLIEGRQNELDTSNTGAGFEQSARNLRAALTLSEHTRVFSWGRKRKSYPA